MVIIKNHQNGCHDSTNLSSWIEAITLPKKNKQTKKQTKTGIPDTQNSYIETGIPVILI